MRTCARAALLIVAVLSASCRSTCPSSECRRLPAGLAPDPSCPAGLPRLGMSYPPVSTPAQRDFTAQQMRMLGVRSLRIEDRWRNRDAAGTGEFDWTGLDERLSWAKAQGLAVMLTLEARSPDSQCQGQPGQSSCVFDLELFRGYVQRLLARHPDELEAIQFGNEWQPREGFVGTAEQFVAANNVLAEEVGRLSPGTKVVLGGFSIGALQILAACDGRFDELTLAEAGQCTTSYRREDGTLDEACAGPVAKEISSRVATVLSLARYDVLDVHLYDDAEQWPLYIDMLRNRYGVKAPLIASEVGGPNLFLECYSDEYQAGRLATYLQVLSSLRLDQAYYFKLVEDETVNEAHRRSGLLKQTGESSAEAKQAFGVFQQFARCAAP